MFEEATEVGDELELTRADLDRWALRSHERAVAATDEGRLAEEIVPVDGARAAKGDTVVEVDEAPAPRHVARAAGRAARAHRAGRLAHGRQLARASTTAPARSCWPPTSGRSARAARCWRRSSPRRPVADDFAYLARTPGQRRAGRARQGGAAAGRHRPVGDQRGVRLRHPELDADARHRRGAGQRQRRRGRHRPPDRRVGRAHPRPRSCSSCAGAAAATAARPSAPAAARATP